MLTATSFTVDRFIIVSSNSFDNTLQKLQAGVGHPDMATFGRALKAAKTEKELEAVVNGAVSPLGLMEFATFDLGDALQKELGEKAPRSIRFLIGNPLIMKELVKRVPDAGSYAPVTILLDERDGKVYISYDSMSSFLAHYGDKEALSIANDLDAKIQGLLKAAAH